MKDTLNVVVLTESQLKQLINETVSELLDQRIPEIIRRANRKEYITSAEFKELTGCSYRVQSYLRSENKITFSQEGRKIFYKTTDVEKFIDERKIERRI